MVPEQSVILEARARKMPVQKPGKSEQDVGTPLWLLRAVQYVWGKITYDAAGSERYHTCDNYDTKETDGLTKNWADRSRVDSGYVYSSIPSWTECDRVYYPGVTWVNPPYSKIGPWVKKAAESGCTVIMLVPASVGSKWWRDWVDGKCLVHFLPRFKFIGHPTVYPKDCALLVYGRGERGYLCLNWTEIKYPGCDLA